MNRRLQTGIWLLLGTLGASHAGVLFHEATVEHVTCPEHGELVHGAAGAVASPVEASYAAPVPVEDDGHASHEHCSLTASGRDATSTSVVARLVPEPRAQLEPRPSNTKPRPTRHLQRLAPKTSPPPPALPS